MKNFCPELTKLILISRVFSGAYFYRLFSGDLSRPKDDAYKIKGSK
jgi:hypothetical protein